MWQWLEDLFTQAKIYIPMILAFITSLGIPTIIATCRTASKATVYLYNVKKLQKKTNETIDYANTIKQAFLSDLESEKAFYVELATQTPNAKKKALIESRIADIGEKIERIKGLEVGQIQLATKEEIKAEKKIKVKITKTAKDIVDTAVDKVL